MATTKQTVPKNYSFVPDEQSFTRGDLALIGWNTIENRNSLSAQYPVYNTINGGFSERTHLYSCWSDDYVTITFDPQGGVSEQGYRRIGRAYPIGILPKVEKTDIEGRHFIGIGWFTEQLKGLQISSSTIFYLDSTIYAHYAINITDDTGGEDTFEENLSSNPIYLIFSDGTTSVDYTYDKENHQPSVISVILNNTPLKLGKDDGDVYIAYCQEHEQCINAGSHYVRVIGSLNQSSKSLSGTIKIGYPINKRQISATSLAGYGTYTSNPHITVNITDSLISNDVDIYYAKGDYLDPPTLGLDWSLTHPTFTYKDIGTNIVSYKIVGKDDNISSNLIEAYGKNTVRVTSPCDCYSCSYSTTYYYWTQMQLYNYGVLYASNSLKYSSSNVSVTIPQQISGMTVISWSYKSKSGFAPDTIELTSTSYASTEPTSFGTDIIKLNTVF